MSDKPKFPIKQHIISGLLLGLFFSAIWAFIDYMGSQKFQIIRYAITGVLLGFFHVLFSYQVFKNVKKNKQ